MTDKRTVTLRLTLDEAIVFYEYLAKLKDQKEKLTEVSAEDRVLWQLERQLEKTLVKPFDPDYEQLVEAPRQRMSADSADKKTLVTLEVQVSLESLASFDSY